MELRFDFVPPGGGKVEYSLVIDLPALPRIGDHISIRRPADETDLFGGTIDFSVISVRWELEYPDNETFEDPENPVIGTAKSIVLDCEFVLSPTSSGAHQAACQNFFHLGRAVRKLSDKT